MGYTKRETKNEYQRNWRAKMRKDTGYRERDKLADRRRHLKNAYGITLEQYDELLDKQNHQCAICDKHTSEQKRNMHVDHDHYTGEIRGLLCAYCNHRLLGRHRDSTLLRKMAEYLEQGTGWFVPKKKPKKRKKP